MKFIKEVTRRDAKYSFIVHVPILAKDVPVIGTDNAKFYLYADPEKNRYILQLVGSLPDPEMVKPRDMQ